VEEPNAGNFKNLITNYGEISIEDLRTWEDTYLNEETREAQDSVQAYLALRHSLSDTGLAKVNVHEQEYMIDGTPSGPLFWKVIVRESHLDTNATALSIRTKLGTSALSEYMESVSYDITKFNQHVLTLIESLQARGETTHDLLSNLFTTYAGVKDDAFRTYIETKRSEYEEGARDLGHTQLMILAENKFKVLLINKQWSHESYEDMILALQAKQDKTNKELEKIKRKHSGKKGDNNGGGGTRKDAKKGQREKEPEPEWMHKEPPKDQLYKPRKWIGRTWWYCSPKTGGKCNPGRYRQHKPKECRGTARKRTDKDKNEPKSGNDDKDSKKKRKLKVIQALHDVDCGSSDTDHE
jgi:hypothetical protein